MKLILFSTQNFLINEFKNSKYFEKIIVIKEIDEIFNILLKEENFIFLHHLDVEDNFFNSLKLLDKNFENFKALALRNNTNNIEGCSLLKKGYKAYLHSLSNINILDDAIDSIIAGNIWVYPELMQFLISSISLKEKKQDDKIKKLSVKELEVLELVAQGLNNNEISEILVVAEITVKKHISSMFRKLELKDRLSLALFYKN